MKWSLPFNQNQCNIQIPSKKHLQPKSREIYIARNLFRSN